MCFISCHPEPTTLSDLRRISKRVARSVDFQIHIFRSFISRPRGRIRMTENKYLISQDDEKYIYQVKETKLCLK